MAEVVLLRKAPTKQQARKIVTEFFTKGAISLSVHAKEKMKERNITMPQIMNCLSKGRIIEEVIYSDKNGGGYETSLEKVAGGDWLKVVICLKLNQKLLIITVIN